MTKRGCLRSLLEGHSIADHLNSVSVLTRRGGRWHPATVRYILDNPKYKGKVEYYFRWQDEGSQVIRDGEHKAILDVNFEGKAINQ